MYARKEGILKWPARSLASSGARYCTSAGQGSKYSQTELVDRYQRGESARSARLR